MGDEGDIRARASVSRSAKFVGLLCLLVGTYLGFEPLTHHFFIPDAPYLVSGVSVTKGEMLKVVEEKSYPAGVQRFIERKENEYPVATALSDVDRALVDQYYRTVSQLEHRLNNTRAIAAVLLVSILGTIAGMGASGMLALVPLVGQVILVRIAWRIASLPDRYWEQGKRSVRDPAGLQAEPVPRD